MLSRKFHAALSCVLFLLLAILYGGAFGVALDVSRIALWSMAGIACYVLLSHVFGFDPYRTRITQYAPAYMQYIDRWELRLGQATLSMLGCVVVAAGLIDEANFATAVVSGTSSAWIYFVLRLYAGGYRAATL